MIKRIKIKGYKKFKDYEIIFNERLNILVGDNESGKSSIIEALNIVLNNKVPFKELSALKYYFNKDNIKNFEDNNTFEDLPKINIEIEFNVKESENLQYQQYYGPKFMENIEKNDYTENKFGIMFECIPDEEYQDEINSEIQKKEIPYEYYTLNWTTFKDEKIKYKSKKPFNTYILDNTKNLDNYSINKYSVNLFNALMEESIKKEVKNSFYAKNVELTDSDNMRIDDEKKFNLLIENTDFSKFISIIDEDILLELKGKGKERLILTELVINSNKNIDTFIIEEPEMNLSNVNLNKMINSITEKYVENEEERMKQLIVTTHSNMVARKLELNNIIYIGKEKAKNFTSLPKDTSNYFLKSDNNNVIDLLNTEKNIIVEGAAEYILLPELFKKFIIEQSEGEIPIQKQMMSYYSINITSGQGLSTKHYENLMSYTGNKTIFITDNDKKNKRIYQIDEDKSYNNISSSDINNWTFEVAIYNANKEYITELLNVENNGKVTKIYDGKEQETKTLAYMLNNKTKVALKLSENVDGLTIPKYIEEAFKWIKN